MSSYESLEAELHDVFWAAEGESVELPLLREFFTRYGGRGLEVGSGSGRLLLPLLEEGLVVDGLEISRDMVRLCEEKARDAGISAVVYEEDAMGFVPRENYGAVAIPSFTWQLFERPWEALERFVSWLPEGGGLFVTVFRPEAELEGDMPENEWYVDYEVEQLDGRVALMATKHVLEREERVLRRWHRYAWQSAEGEILEEHESEQTVRWFEEEEIAREFAHLGLEVERAVGDFELPTFFPARNEPPQILTLFARKVRR